MFATTSWATARHWAFIFPRRPTAEPRSRSLRKITRGHSWLPTLWSVTDPNHKRLAQRRTIAAQWRTGHHQLRRAAGTRRRSDDPARAVRLSMLPPRQRRWHLQRLACRTPTASPVSDITPNGSNCNIQALINGSATGPVLTTTPGTSICLRDAADLQRGTPRSSDVSVVASSGRQRPRRGRDPRPRCGSCLPCTMSIRAIPAPWRRPPPFSTTMCCPRRRASPPMR